MLLESISVYSFDGSNQLQFGRITQKTKLPAWVMDSPEMEEIVEECNFIIIVYVLISTTSDTQQTNWELQCQRHSITQEGDCKYPSPGDTHLKA